MHFDSVFTILIIMKILLTLLVLLFSSSVVADDISEFQIEGISVGDSALDFFSKEEIKNTEKDYYKNKKFTPVEIKELTFFKTYDAVDFNYKTGDNKYIIHAIAGAIYFRDNIEDCYLKMNKIVEEIKEVLKDVNYRIEKTEVKHPIDKSDRSNIKSVYFYLNSDDAITIQCYNYSEDLPYPDHLRVFLTTNEYITFLQYEAY